MAKNAYILFIDSGIGGISILKTFLAKKPKMNIIYYADVINFPYGDKDEHHLAEILFQIISRLSSREIIPLVVIACNTASVAALDLLRQKISLPIIGTVPAVKPAASATRNGKIGIIGTANTVRLEYLSNLIHDFAQDKQVFVKAAPRLVKLAEGMIIPSEMPQIFQEELEELKTQGIDVLVLGCTHYAFLADEIEAYFNRQVKIIDSREGVSNRILQLLPSIAELENNDRILYLSSDHNNHPAKYQEINNREHIFNQIIIEDLSWPSA